MLNFSTMQSTKSYKKTTTTCSNHNNNLRLLKREQLYIVISQINMSRKQNIAAQKLLAEQAIYQKQCSVWMRSLQRNDSDIAAVVELNRSLHVVKNAFLHTYNNELLLLHVGLGKYRLSPDGSDLLVKPVLTTPPQQIPSSKPSSPTKGSTTKNSLATPANANASATTKASSSNNNSNTILKYQVIADDEITAEQQELCVDFLLRKKLRRKLISRIIRRLQRIATSMDHLEQMTIPSSTNTINLINTITDVVAPSGPPKYGDLRLYCDPNAVQEFAQVQQKQIQAWHHIISIREQEECSRFDSEPSASPISSPKRHIVKSPVIPAVSKTTTSTTGDDTRKESSSVAAADIKTDPDDKQESLLPHNEVTQPIQSEEDGQGGEQENKIDTTDTTDSVSLKVEQEEGSAINDLAEAPTVSSNTDADKVEATTTSSAVDDDAVNGTPSVVPSSSNVFTETSMTDTPNEPTSTTMEDRADPLAADFELFLDYKDAYEKLMSSVIPIDDGSVVPDSTHVASFLQNLPPGKMNVNYTILQDQRDEDYMIIKNGIGATHPNMTIQEREAEYHKWESNLLSRIPEQPTYAELGYENRVFLYEDRMQRAVEKQNEQGKQEQRDDEIPTKGSDEDNMDIDDKNTPKENEKDTDTLNENDEDTIKEDNIVDVAMDEDAVVADTAIDEEAMNDAENGQEFGDEGAKNDEMEKDLDKVEPKQLRPISLVAIPSFYEQDLKRIKLVQAELMASSMREHAIHRLEDVTQEFNQCTYF